MYNISNVCSMCMYVCMYVWYKSKIKEFNLIGTNSTKHTITRFKYNVLPNRILIFFLFTDLFQSGSKPFCPSENHCSSA